MNAGQRGGVTGHLGKEAIGQSERIRGHEVGGRGGGEQNHEQRSNFCYRTNGERRPKPEGASRVDSPYLLLELKQDSPLSGVSSNQTRDSRDRKSVV